MDAPHDLRKVKSLKFNLKDPVSYRKALGESQGTFWQRFGVTQSGGSRYESGRTIPRPVRMLMALYASGTLSDEDLKDAAVAKPKRGRAGV
jgi:hypothetical protein